MELPTPKLRQEYADEIKVIEANIKDISSGTASEELYRYSQDKLDKLAKRFQHNEQIGTARYKLYELQALLYYFQNRDDDALAFINQAIEVRGASYKRAEQLIEQLQSAPVAVKGRNISSPSKKQNSELPLQLQSLIKGLRTSAIIMAVISIISVYFIPWAVFYIILARKLRPEKVPSRKLIKGAAIATLPLCLGLIPILIDIEFWKMNRRLKEFEEQGSSAFISDKEFLAGEPKRKRRNKIARTILLSIIVVFTILVIVALASSGSGSNTTNKPGSFLYSETPTPYTSTEYNFVINFPGFPEADHQTLQESGYDIPYTLYTTETDNGNKAYLVGVYDFSGIEINETGALEGAVNGAVQNTEGATLLSSNFSAFLGLKSIDARYNIPLEGKNYDGYIKAFIKDSKMYAIFTIGENKSDFDIFVNSFRFR